MTLDPADDFAGLPRQQRRHQARQRRKAQCKMAKALGIDYSRPEYNDPTDPWALWEAIKKETAGGKLTSPHSEAPPIGDGFAIFVRGVCVNPEHREPPEFTLVHKCVNGYAYDQAEAEKVIAYLKAEHPTCEHCEQEITTWHCEQNRISIYADNEKVRIGA